MALPGSPQGIQMGASTTTETRALNEIFTLQQILGDEAQPILEAAAKDLAAIALGNQAGSETEDLIQVSQDPNHPAWQFVKQLGFDPQTMNTELIRQSIETFNKELSGQISQLVARKRSLEEESDTAIAMKEIMPLMITLGMVAPEMAPKVMPMLIAMAPKIKQNALRKIEDQINTLQKQNMEQNLQAGNIISQMENRRTAAGRLAMSFMQEARKARTDSLRTRVRAIGQLMDTWIRSERLKQQAQIQSRAAINQLLRGIQDYENLVWRTIMNIPDYPDVNQAIRARQSLLESINERRLALRETLREMRQTFSDRNDQQGVQTVDLFLAIVQPYSGDEIQLMAQQARNANAALATDRVRFLRAASAANLSRASLDNARELTETLFATAGGRPVIDIMLKQGSEFSQAGYEEFKRSIEASGTIENTRRAFEAYAAQGAMLAHGVGKISQASITAARNTNRTNLIPEIKNQNNIAIQALERQLASAAHSALQRMYQQTFNQQLSTPAPNTLDETLAQINKLKQQYQAREDQPSRVFYSEISILEAEINKAKEIISESRLP